MYSNVGYARDTKNGQILLCTEEEELATVFEVWQNNWI